VSTAATLATILLQPTPDRLHHTAGVAEWAEFLTALLEPEQAPLLLAAAWLHDIGSAEQLRDTGFPPIDGARFLERSGWPPKVCSLVAHHSGARFVAAALGLGGQMGGSRFVVDPLTDALTVADLSTGARGEPVAIEDRLADQLAFHGRDSAYGQVFEQRATYVHSCAVRIDALLERAS
jgi:hypothetical protein